MRVGQIEPSAVSRLFSPCVLRQMYRTGSSPLFARLARQTNLIDAHSPQRRVRDFFDAAFAALAQKRCRDEYVYRNAIAQRVLLGTHKLNTASILNEFRVCDRIADVVILNGTSTAYEIKSERDTLKRVAAQTSTYLRVFAQVYVIAGDDHVEALLRTVPTCVGVMSLSNRLNISTVREAQPQPESISPQAVVDSLRVAESKMILSELGVPAPDVPNTQMYAELRALFSGIEPRRVHDAMVTILRKTRSSESLAQVLEIVPSSLQAAVLSTRPRPPERERLVDALSRPLAQALRWG